MLDIPSNYIVERIVEDLGFLDTRRLEWSLIIICFHLRHPQHVKDGVPRHLIIYSFTKFNGY